jgi:hypothetical protein
MKARTALGIFVNIFRGVLEWEWKYSDDDKRKMLFVNLEHRGWRVILMSCRVHICMFGWKTIQRIRGLGRFLSVTQRLGKSRKNQRC